MKCHLNLVTVAVVAGLLQACFEPAAAQVNQDSTQTRVDDPSAERALANLFETGRVDNVVIARIKRWEDLRPKLPNLTLGTDTPMADFDYHIELTEIQILLTESFTHPALGAYVETPPLPMWVGGCFPARLGLPSPRHLPIHEKRIFAVTANALSPDKTFYTAHCTGRALSLSDLPKLKRILARTKPNAQ